MKIACLGWGSLVWDSRDLPLSSDWNTDGPDLPIEFSRESSDGRMTLVLVDGVKKSLSLWALLTAENIKTAKDHLAAREGICEKNINYSIGYRVFNPDMSHGKCSEEISKWASAKGLDGVVWTNLKCGFKSTRGMAPLLPSVMEHLCRLPLKDRSAAERYVRKTPAQIRTTFRDEFENKLGWYPISSDA